MTGVECDERDDVSFPRIKRGKAEASETALILGIAPWAAPQFMGVDVKFGTDQPAVAVIEVLLSGEQLEALMRLAQAGAVPRSAKGGPR